MRFLVSEVPLYNKSSDALQKVCAPAQGGKGKVEKMDLQPPKVCTQYVIDLKL
jgi:hypothetical protein